MASYTDSGEEPRAERKMFICDDCGREYMRKSSFTRHIRIHEETVKPGAKMNRHVKSKKKKLSAKECYCKSCQDSILLADLDSHICAPTAAQESFTCPGCGKFFSHESTLRRHLSLHDKIPEFLYENELREGSVNGGAGGLIREQSPVTACSTADVDNNCASASTSISSPPRDLVEVTPEQNKKISELEVSSRSVRAGPSGVSNSLKSPRSSNTSRKRQPPKANYVPKKTKQCISRPGDPQIPSETNALRVTKTYAKKGENSPSQNVQKNSWSSQLQSTGTVSTRIIKRSGYKILAVQQTTSLASNGGNFTTGQKHALKKTTQHLGPSNEGIMALTREAAEPPTEQLLIKSEANVSETCCNDNEETAIHRNVFMDSLGLHSEGRAVGSTHRIEALEHDDKSTGVTNQLVFPESSEGARQSTSAAPGRGVPVPVASASLETETHIPTNPPGKRRTAVRSVKTRILGTTTIDPESGLAPVYNMKLFGTFSQPGTNEPIQVWAIDESRRPFAARTRPPMVAGSAGSGEGCTAGSKSVQPQQTVDNTHSEIPRGDTQIAHSSDVSEGGNGPIPATTVCGHHPEPVRHEAACVSQRNWGNVPLTSNMGMGQVPCYGIGPGLQQGNSVVLTEPVARSIVPPIYNRPMLLNNQMYNGLYYQNAGPQARVPGAAVHQSMMHQGMMPHTPSQELHSRFFYPC